MKSIMTSALIWYQKKIGAYDKQSWEKTVDQRILRGMSAVPKKTARLKTELIDVDLVRGSAFPKAKPQHSWIAAALSGIVRVLLLPLCLSWWQIQTNSLVSSCLVILYVLQIMAIYIFYSADESCFTNISSSEVWIPAAMVLILGVVHSQIVATFANKNSHKRVAKTKRKRMKHKKLKSLAESETKSSPDSEGQKIVTFPVLDTNANHSINHICKSQQSSPFQTLSENIINPVLKKSSDDESGLDVADISENVSKHNFISTVVDKCHCNCQSSCHSSCFPKKSSTHTESTKASSMNSLEHYYSATNNIDADNVSSGEDYFVPKKPHFTNNQWKKYIIDMKRNGSSKELWCQTKRKFYRSHNKSHFRRFSDIGPVRASHYDKDSNDIHNSENDFRCFTDPCDISTVLEKTDLYTLKDGLRMRRPIPSGLRLHIQDAISSAESELETSPNSPKPRTSDLEWPLVTNTDYNSDTSDCPSQSTQQEESDTSPSENPFAWEMQESAATSMSAVGPHSNKGPKSRTVSCTIWERNECKKVDLSVLDISSAIIQKVDSSIPSTEYLSMGVLFATIITLLPLFFRLQSGPTMDSIQDVTLEVMNFTVPNTQDLVQIMQDMVEVMLGSNYTAKIVVCIFMIERFTLSLTYFFILSVAEKTFKQRFLYAKNFCYLTSSRRARRTDLPHFRLNKVRNIKTWLSVRSYLKKLGPQRSVDVIVSSAFILEVCVLSFLCVQLLKETGHFVMKLHCWETLVWTLALGFFLLRFMTIGSKINKKYRNLSVLITEQINLYLHMEQKPHKKNELMLANSVLKLAADLLKELESPFKISGLSANPFLYNFTKVVVLSAFSAVLTEVLGFKLKLYKMKIK